MSKANEASPATNGSDLERLVRHWECGWCGRPTQQDGTPLTMSEIGLQKDVDRDAWPVSGKCCKDENDKALVDDFDA